MIYRSSSSAYTTARLVTGRRERREVYLGMVESAILYGVLGAVVNGLRVGSLYGLMALGLTLIFRVTKVPNFAYAEYITYGAYAAYLAAIAAGAGGAGLVAALIIAVFVGAAAALASDEIAFKPLWKRGATPLHLLVASIGVGLVLRYSLLAVAASAAGLLEAALPVRSATILSIGGIVSVETSHLLAVGAAVVFAAALHWLFTRTRTGKAMRATASNPVLARVTGINIYAIRRITWLIGGGLAGFAGFVYAYYYYVNPESGWLMLLWIFAAATMGGFTFYGSIVSGVLLGLAEQVVSFLANTYLGLSTAYAPVIALVALIVVLMYRPEGVIRLESLSLKRRA